MYLHDCIIKYNRRIVDILDRTRIKIVCMVFNDQSFAFGAVLTLR